MRDLNIRFPHWLCQQNFQHDADSRSLQTTAQKNQPALWCRHELLLTPRNQQDWFDLDRLLFDLAQKLLTHMFAENIYLRVSWARERVRIGHRAACKVGIKRNESTPYTSRKHNSFTHVLWPSRTRSTKIAIYSASKEVGAKNSVGNFSALLQVLVNISKTFCSKSSNA